MHASKTRLTTAGLVVVALAACAISSCSKPDNESCDGGRPAATVEQAVRGLIAASETGDFDAACAVVTNRPSEQKMTTALADLNRQGKSIGITSSSASIKELEQGGSLIPIEISNGKSTKNIQLNVMKIRDEGYRIIWP